MKTTCICTGIVLFVLFAVAASDVVCAIELECGCENSLPENDENALPEDDYAYQGADGIVINEIMADNDSTVKGPIGSFSDWIELYNDGTSQIDISGMHISDDTTDPMKWKIPEGTVIGPGEYLVIWADGSDTSEGLHASFRLDANGETVALYTQDGKQLIDSVSYDKQLRDTSYGRIPDAGDTWEYLRTPTPNGTNIMFSRYVDAPVWTIFVPLLIATAMLMVASKITEKGAEGKRND